LNTYGLSETHFGEVIALAFVPTLVAGSLPFVLRFLQKRPVTKYGAMCLWILMDCVIIIIQGSYCNKVEPALSKLLPAVLEAEHFAALIIFFAVLVYWDRHLKKVDAAKS
jgi:hypothetical protein